MEPQGAPTAPGTGASGPGPTRAALLVSLFVLLVVVGCLGAVAQGSRGTSTVAAAASPTMAGSPAPVTEALDPGDGTTAATDAPPSTAAPTTAAPTTTIDQRGPVGPVTPIGPVNGLSPIISRVATTDPVIFVTIDDGLVADPRVLDLLTTTGMPVTMFLNAAPAREHTAYFEAIRQLGNTVNSHTLTHPNLTKVSAAEQARQICGMRDVLVELFGVEGGLFRAPFGATNTSVRQQAAQCGQRAVLSWAGTLNNGALQLQEAALRPGDILLTHFRDDLYDNLVEIQRLADAAGLRIARLDPYLPAG